MIESSEQKLIRLNCLYGHTNVLFRLAIRRLIKRPVVGLCVAFALFLFFVIAALFLGCLIPEHLWQITDPFTRVKALLALRDRSYLVGDKFALLFYGVIAPVSTFVWLRHCLVVHPRALIAIAKANRSGVASHMARAYRQVNAWWIEVVGIFIAGIACIARARFLDAGTEWFMHSLFLYVPIMGATFGLWYILPTFIGKGFILVTRHHFHVSRGAPFYFYIERDPFQVNDFMKDVFSVLYFIFTGGFTILAYSFLAKPGSLIIKILLPLYAAIFPFWIIRFVVIYRALQASKQAAIRTYQQSLIMRWGDRPYERGITKCDIDIQESLMKAMSSAALIRVVLGKSAFVGTVYFLQVILIAYRFLGRSDTTFIQFLKEVLSAAPK